MGTKTCTKEKNIKVFAYNDAVASRLMLCLVHEDLCICCLCSLTMYYRDPMLEEFVRQKNHMLTKEKRGKELIIRYHSLGMLPENEL